ncbi:MAG TPA: signal peptidase I [Verrucomicrobiae bacterium]|nr:signal peptidase I [Verrucomicrobiae bacterium]
MLIHTYRSAGTSEDQAPGKPWLAAFLSCLIPGLGQFYNHEFFLGIAFLGLVVGTTLLPKPVQAVVLYLIELGSIIQAFRSRSRREHVQSNGVRLLVWAWLAHGVLVALVIVGNRTFLFQPFRIPTGAMEPTLHGDGKVGAENRLLGDHLFVDKLAYRLGPPRRGDIVVFRTDEIPDLAKSSRGEYYAKRIVGLPGERVSIRPPYLYINGQRVTDPPIFQTVAQRDNGYSGFALIPQARYLGSESDSVQLGADEYFVLGDNSPRSLDSRFWGPVPKRSIVGRVTKIYWPSDRMGIVPQ